MHGKWVLCKSFPKLFVKKQNSMDFRRINGISTVLNITPKIRVKFNDKKEFFDHF